MNKYIPGNIIVPGNNLLSGGVGGGGGEGRGGSTTIEAFNCWRIVMMTK